MRLEEEAKQWMEERNMSTITATEYQIKQRDVLSFLSTKLWSILPWATGEAGEIANKVKKLTVMEPMWKVTMIRKTRLAMRLVTCYGTAMLAKEVDMNLGLIMENTLKLADRKARIALKVMGIIVRYNALR